MSAPTDAEITAVATKTLPQLPHVFEIALVLGGTVSAGAYTAGVLDFLIQALDCWEAERAKGQKVPRHRVVLRVVAGTSGGGVNAAILARALAFDFPHNVTAASPTGAEESGNPFYDTWTTKMRGPGGGIGLKGLLETGDLRSTGTVPSLLCGLPIDAAAAYAAGFTGAPTGAPKRRAWVGRPIGATADRIDPLHVILTLTNLRGVPYVTDMGPHRTETFVNHADHARFAICYPGTASDSLRPDEWALGFETAGAARELNWSDFSMFARATSAFPVGLPARELTRPASDYYYRTTLLQQEGELPKLLPLRPDWHRMGDATSLYSFGSVDGGVTDNEPIELARTALSGALGLEPRDGKTAHRAVVLVDPFAGQAPRGPASAPTALPLLGGLVTTVTQQTRYDTSDLLLATEPEVYSRFMVTAVREHSRTGQQVVGNDALASSGLDAFMGFASTKFMRHDFLLGRRNCQQFLRKSFVLPEHADVFRDMWTGVDTSEFAVPDDKGGIDLPLVPLYDDAKPDVPACSWPFNAVDPEVFRDAVCERIKGVAGILADAGFAGGIKGWLAGELGGPAIADYAVDAMRTALQKGADPLLPPGKPIPPAGPIPGEFGGC